MAHLYNISIKLAIKKFKTPPVQLNLATQEEC